MQYRVSAGRPLPLGVHDCGEGFNFSLFSRHADRIELLLFADASAPEPVLTADLVPPQHRTGDIWHALIEGVRWGQGYMFRAHGPWAPDQGHRFDGKKLLLDPYALLVHAPAGPAAESVSKATATGSGTNRLRSVLINRLFDWQGTVRPKTPWSETIIYETHIRGLTIDPSAGASHPGTFLGVIEKIPYFQELGITAVELMPIQKFDQGDNPRSDPVAGTPLRNYWGYNTMAFFAPNGAYSTRQAPDSPVLEFKTMVRALHRAGIEVILDVVFNHTAEGGEKGPTFNFRGLDNVIYYILDHDKSRYRDYSGCGNTLNCNHPVVRDYVIDCLRYWAAEMQVDGFRFDLASILGRDEHGSMMINPPLLERIAEDPILRDVKLIAEAWDSAGAYQVGNFPGPRWAEWNARFRDDVRRFWRGDAGMTGAIASRLCGSADLYQRSGKRPLNSINFITCHDGFTLSDLVSYARKHNEANGEANRDGVDENYSINYGVEGPADDPVIEERRLLQIKSMFATLFLSRGVPMLLGGDEFRRTQQGNNNAYCQDNALSWYDWRLLTKNQDLVRFVCELIALRKRNPVLSAETFYTADDIQWFGPLGRAPDWNGPTRALGCLVRSGPSNRKDDGAGALCLLLNASRAPAEFILPEPVAPGWRIRVDTAKPMPHDIAAAGDEPSALAQRALGVAPGAFVLLSSD